MTAALWFTSVWTHSVFGLMSQSNVHEEIGETEDLLAASQEGDLPKTPSKALKRPATAKPKAQGNAKGKPKIKAKAKAKAASNMGKNKKVKDGDKQTLKRALVSRGEAVGQRRWTRRRSNLRKKSWSMTDQGEECEVSKKDKSKDAKFKVTCATPTSK